MSAEGGGSGSGATGKTAREAAAIRQRRGQREGSGGGVKKAAAAAKRRQQRWQREGSDGTTAAAMAAPQCCHCGSNGGNGGRYDVCGG